MKNSLYHSHYSHFRAGMGQLLCGRNWFVGQDFQPTAPEHCGVPASWIKAPIPPTQTFYSYANAYRVFVTQCGYKAVSTNPLSI